MTVNFQVKFWSFSKAGPLVLQSGLTRFCPVVHKGRVWSGEMVESYSLIRGRPMALLNRGRGCPYSMSPFQSLICSWSFIYGGISYLYGLPPWRFFWLKSLALFEIRLLTLPNLTLLNPPLLEPRFSDFCPSF